MRFGSVVRGLVCLVWSGLLKLGQCNRGGKRAMVGSRGWGVVGDGDK